MGWFELEKREQRGLVPGEDWLEESLSQLLKVRTGVQI